jgi:hypothetical protein
LQFHHRRHANVESHHFAAHSMHQPTNKDDVSSSFLVLSGNESIASGFNNPLVLAILHNELLEFISNLVVNNIVNWAAKS